MIWWCICLSVIRPFSDANQLWEIWQTLKQVTRMRSDRKQACIRNYDVFSTKQKYAALKLKFCFSDNLTFLKDNVVFFNYPIVQVEFVKYWTFVNFLDCKKMKYLFLFSKMFQCRNSSVFMKKSMQRKLKTTVLLNFSFLELAIREMESS